MTDDTITFEPSDRKYQDAESNEVSLGTALRGFECPECGDTVRWVLQPDPDSLKYYSDTPCSCNYNYYIEPTKVILTRHDANL